jgi:protein SCO1/2
MWRPAIAAICLSMGQNSLALADPRTDAALQVSQGVIGSSVPDLIFQDAEGNRIDLGKLHGKPLLITLIYTSCARVCPTLIENLTPAVAAADDVLGKGSFNVLTIGFDTQKDTPDRMRAFARTHGARGDNWFFAGSDKNTMDRLSSAVGFSYFSSTGGFDHLAQVTILDKTGAVYQQVYGSTFGIPDIVEPLKQLILGRERSAFSLAGLSDRVRLFCTVFDPNSGRYYFNYSLLVSIFVGAGCLLGIFIFLFRETRRSLRSGGV